MVKKPNKIRARLVCQEVNRGSWQDTYAATPVAMSQRFLLTLASKEGWEVWFGDISVAFLHAPLDPGMLVVVIPPLTHRKPGRGWLLGKALYGLRQSPRLFQQWLAKELEKLHWSVPRLIRRCISKGRRLRCLASMPMT